MSCRDPGAAYSLELLLDSVCGCKVCNHSYSHLVVYPLSLQAAASIVWLQRGDEGRGFSDPPTHQEASAPEEENQTV